MKIEPKFVKPDDFYNYTGKNLYELLNCDENESNKADLFLLKIEDSLLCRIDSTSFRLTDWDNLSSYQLECLQKAIIYQAEYIIRNSDLFTDSGYDMERGFIADPDKLQKAAICPISKDLLLNCGIINHVIHNRKRYTDLGLTRR